MQEIVLKDFKNKQWKIRLILIFELPIPYNKLRPDILKEDTF
jgi:hypothetical protein